MRSLRSIITRLSPHEVETFRTFLSSHCKNGKNKKLELFDRLIHRTPDELSAGPMEVSRQSIYQLKKRLTEELYAFLLTQEQARDNDEQAFLEMECHKKLYTFKILFDKGILDHAHQMLSDVLNIASRHALHSLYLEAVNLRNIYFPLAKAMTVKRVPVNQEIRKLKKSLGRNLYINQYLSESGSFLHESDDGFRLRLMNQLGEFDLGGNEPVIDRMLEVNHLFYAKDFSAAYSKLTSILETDADIASDANTLTLLYIELTKAAIGLNALFEARKWLSEVEARVSRPDPFVHLLLELQYILAVRSGDTAKLKGLLEHARLLPDIRENPVLAARWSFYSLLENFLKRDYKKVIKVANGNPALLLKDKSWLMNVKMLELLSVCALKDSDWLYYKVESFRKMLSGAQGKQRRICQVVNLLKLHAIGKEISQSDADERISKIESENSWHPLSNEMINYCSYLRTILGVDVPVYSDAV